MAQSKPVKFARMVDLPDMTDNNQGGFSNRYNIDTHELGESLRKLEKFKTKKMQVTVTQKVDGVSSMLVAFVAPVNDHTGGNRERTMRQDTDEVMWGNFGNADDAAKLPVNPAENVDAKRLAEMKSEAAGEAARKAAEERGEGTGEIGGPKGLEPTRYGDWEKSGRCVDF